MRQIWAAAALAATALAVSACGSSGSSSAGSAPASPTTASPAPASSAPASPAAAPGGSTLTTKTIAGAQVVTDARGFTLYWFAPDTPAASRCSGSCATYWPPVKGPATAGAGVTGKLGTVKRPDGTVQATYDGHPLYTYAGDTAPGDAKGNGLNASGGLWYEMTVSGAAPGAGTSASAGTSSGYGGGY